MPPLDAPTVGQEENNTQAAGETIGRDIIQVEANLLCFPFFALAKKDRAKRQAIEVFGTRMREDGIKQRFSLRIARNVDLPYPGILSRKVHFALLDILSDRSRPRPLQNPVTWTWRDLHERIGIEYAGQSSVSAMKEALHSTAGVYITTTCGLIVKSGDDKAPLPSRETGYHLYDKVVFVNDALPDGTVADRNAVWLSDWYLANLNEFYSGPLNYDLWKRLDEKQIASRLYEFLLFKCYGAPPILRINYPYLASFLPVRIESALSKAQEQLNPAFAALGKHHVLRRIEWTTSQSGQHQLLVTPGPALARSFAAAPRQPSIPHGILEFSDLHVMEVLTEHTKAHQLVCRYHALRFDQSRHVPTASELSFAQEKLDVFSDDLLNALLPKLAQTMEREFPKGKFFTAAGPYLDDLVAEYQKEQATRRRLEDERHKSEATERRAHQAKEARRKRDARLTAVFESLPPTAQQRLWDDALSAAQSQFDRDQVALARRNGKLHFLLLDTLARKQESLHEAA